MTAPARRKSGARKPSRFFLTPEERAERIEAARAQLAAGVEGLLTSEGWQRLVESRRWLSRYSLANQLMILMQYPDATDVRPLSTWNAAGCLVRKGERQIKIWAPSRRRTEGTPNEGETTGETPAIDPLASSGVKATAHTRFVLVGVFDRSQLVDPPAPAEPGLPAELHGDAPAGLWDSVAALVSAEGYVIERGDCAGAYGTTDLGARTVRVRSDVDPAQAAKTLTHELAHILMGHDGTMPGRVREVEAESVACIVASVAGLDTLGYSVPYVAGWAGDSEAVEASAKRVLATADTILDRLDITHPATSKEN